MLIYSHYLFVSSIWKYLFNYRCTIWTMSISCPKLSGIMHKCWK
nr:MAG TPA: hypothetical protein [Caudoviricetes sp.]